MIKSYKENDIVLGVVTGIEDYGIFVKLDKINSGLIHISEIDDKYIDDLHKYAQVDELIRVRVLGKTEEGMFRLSIKKLDYRITNRHDSKIKETPNGFRNLALHLDYWISKELNTTKKWKKIANIIDILQIKWYI